MSSPLGSGRLMAGLTLAAAALVLPGCATVRNETVRAQGPDAAPIAASPLGTSPAEALPTAPSPLTRTPDGPGNLGPIARDRFQNNAAGGESESAILRNRLRDTAESGEDPKFNYPDINSDPIQRYREKFGLTNHGDPFLFPRLVNLIFEDRWLLAEPDPTIATRNQYARRIDIDIRDPDPDTANFPNGAYTLPKGRVYIENSPVGFFSASRNGNTPAIYQWEFLFRYGLTDNLEFRLFSNGLSYQKAVGKQPAVTGFSPLAFDFKANFWEENTRYFVPAMGVEIYIQTNFGSPAFNGGTQPSINLLFDQSLPFEIGFEYNFGITGVQNSQGQIVYQFSYQWSLQRELFEDFDVFFHGFYNAAALPRLVRFQGAPGADPEAAVPKVTVMGLGYIWTLNDRLSVFGSYNFGVTDAAPRTIALMGFAVAF